MAAEQRFEILGIRHHGPGSARSVQRALAELQPNVVVIEGPPELDEVAHLAGSEAMQPPVAALVYAPEEPQLASFYPMAVFSPEWVALRWALAADVPVRFADLPASQMLAIESARRLTAADVSEHVGAAGDPTDHHRPAPAGNLEGPPDAIRAMASAAGYDDPERWWEDAIEQRRAGDDTLARFDSVRDAIAEFRLSIDDDQVTAQREAAMRKVLRAVAKEGHERVAVVCGAYHAPVLHPDTWPSMALDNALLKGLTKIKVAATWSPWTSRRLATASGYGAGVTSPGWYHHLFTSPADHSTRNRQNDEADDPDQRNEERRDGQQNDVVIPWMVRVAHCLRDEHFDASSASVVEASRLAGALATVRGRPLAGLDEVNDAAQTVLTGGSTLPLKLVMDKLIVGAELGAVPDDTPSVPLARDLARSQTALRLKPSASQKTITLDLRKDAQLERSQLLHRLRLLDVPWGVVTDVGRTGGTFKEAWILEWHPEFTIALIEASMFGSTVESAASASVVRDAEQAADLAELCALVEQCLQADLPDALAAVLVELEVKTAATTDTKALAAAVEPLARTQRYSDVRGADTEIVAGVLQVLVTRTAIGLAGSCVQLDDDAAAEMRAAIEGVQRGIHLTDRDELAILWNEAVDRLAMRRDVHGSIVGRLNRMALDGGRVDGGVVGERLGRALSRASDGTDAAAWLDGFLAGDAVLLIHDPHLLSLINQWVSQLPSDTFDDLLPLLRRTFSRFKWPERRMIGERVKHGGSRVAVEDDGADIDVEQAAPAVAKVAALMGLSAHPMQGATE